MNQTETALRAIKDKIAAVMGALDEAAAEAHRKENRQRLARGASDLHRCADEIQDIIMRIRPR